MAIVAVFVGVDRVIRNQAFRKAGFDDRPTRAVSIRGSSCSLSCVSAQTGASSGPRGRLLLACKAVEEPASTFRVPVPPRIHKLIIPLVKPRVSAIIRKF